MEGRLDVFSLVNPVAYSAVPDSIGSGDRRESGDGAPAVATAPAIPKGLSHGAKWGELIALQAEFAKLNDKQVHQVLGGGGPLKTAVEGKRRVTRAMADSIDAVLQSRDGNHDALDAQVRHYATLPETVAAITYRGGFFGYFKGGESRTYGLMNRLYKALGLHLGEDASPDFPREILTPARDAVAANGYGNVVSSLGFSGPVSNHRHDEHSPTGAK